MHTVSSLEDQMTAERARLDTAETMYVNLTKGRNDYENQVNQLISEAKQAHDTAQASSNQIGIESQARVSLDAKMDFVNNKVDQLVHEHEHLKRVEETHYAQQQMQMATAQASQDKGSGSSGG